MRRSFENGGGVIGVILAATTIAGIAITEILILTVVVVGVTLMEVADAPAIKGATTTIKIDDISHMMTGGETTITDNKIGEVGEAGIITTIAGEAVVEEVEVIKTKMEAIKPRIFITIPINNSKDIKEITFINIISDHFSGIGTNGKDVFDYKKSLVQHVKTRVNLFAERRREI